MKDWLSTKVKPLCIKLYSIKGVATRLESLYLGLMKRLAIAMMTGVGYYLHKEWKKRKQLQLSESTLRQAEKQLYNHFKELMDYGYEVSENRNVHQYNLRFSKPEKIALVMSLRPSKQLKCLIILTVDNKASMHDINDFLSARGHKSFSAKDFRSFEDYLLVLSSRIKSELISDHKS